MFRSAAAFILASAALMLAACNGASDTNEPVVMQNGEAAAPAGPAPAEAHGQDFVSSVLGSYDFAIASAQAVSRKASRADVRQFAQRLANELGESAAQLKAVATVQNLTLDSVPSATDQSDLAIISSASGDPLETAFAEQQLRTLSALVGTLRAYKNGGDNPQLKSWAEDNQARVNDLLLDLQTLNAEIEGRD